MKDYYAILEITPNASDEVIKAAYRALVKKYHPDVVGSSYSQEKMTQVNEAYSVLSDKSKRSKYDMQRGHTSFNGDTISFEAFENVRRQKEQAEREAKVAKEAAQKEKERFERQLDAMRKTLEKERAERNAAEHFAYQNARKQKTTQNNEEKKDNNKQEKKNKESKKKLVRNDIGLAIITLCAVLIVFFAIYFLKMKSSLKEENSSLNYIISENRNTTKEIEQKQAKPQIVQLSTTFTLGDGFERVKMSMGDPDKAANTGSFERWYYGSSFIDISDERGVFAWHKGDTELKAFLGYKVKDSVFRLGSDRDTVAKANGTPDTIEHAVFCDTRMYYGTSYVEFDERLKVVGWYVGNTKLNIEKNSATAGYSFAIGSKDTDLLKAMGTPDGISYEGTKSKWYYGDSYVEIHMSNNEIIHYREKSVPLKVKK